MNLAVAIVAATAMAMAACSSPRAAPDAGPVPRTLFLDFEGITLAPPAIAGAPADATAGTTPLVTASVVLPRYLDGVTDRASRIAIIATTAQAVLEPYAIAVVVEAPATGGYAMMVYTGTSDVVGTPGLSELLASDCAGNNPVEVGLSFALDANDDDPSFTPLYRASLAVAMVGGAAGVPFTTTAGDCMCVLDAACLADAPNECAIGGAGTTVDAAHACTGAPTTPASIDERAQFLAAFGAS